MGDAPIPPIRTFNDLPGLDTAEFTRRTQCSCKPGIAFRNRGHAGHRCLCGFGDFRPPVPVA